MQEKKIVVSLVKKKLNLGEPVNKPVLVMNLTNNHHDAISDFAIDEWAEDVMSLVKENVLKGITETTVNFTNKIAFLKMSAFVKKEELSNLLIEKDNVRYDLVFRNGRSDCELLSENGLNLFVTEDVIYELL